MVLVRDLTPYEEVAAYDKHDTDGGQHETGPVQVVLVAHKADPTHRVSIHLEGDRCVMCMFYFELHREVVLSLSHICMARTLKMGQVWGSSLSHHTSNKSLLQMDPFVVGI